MLYLIGETVGKGYSHPAPGLSRLHGTIGIKFQRYPAIFGSQNFKEANVNADKLTGSRKSKIWNAKPEVAISQVDDMLETKFNWPVNHFTNGNADNEKRHRMANLQDGESQTGSNDICGPF